MKLRSRREGEYMSLEAIERVSQAEVKNQERKAAAEAEAKLIVAQAEQDGFALLQQMRAAEEQSGKQMLERAEAKAAERAAQIAQAAREEGEALQKRAAEQLDAAAEFIVRRVVSI